MTQPLRRKYTFRAQDRKVVVVKKAGERAEAGRVGRDKVASLARRYRGTHLALARWDTPLQPFEEIVRDAVAGLRRAAPLDLIRFPPDALHRFVDDRGEIRIRHDELDWLRIGPSP